MAFVLVIHIYVHIIDQLSCLILQWIGTYQYLDIDVYFKYKNTFDILPYNGSALDSVVLNEVC